MTDTTREQLLAEIKAFTQADPGEIVLDAQSRLGDIYTLAMNAGATDTAESIAQVYSRVMELTNVNAKAVDLAVIARDMLQTVSDQLIAETQARLTASTELNDIHADLKKADTWWMIENENVKQFADGIRQELESDVMEYMYDDEQIQEQGVERLLTDGLPALEPVEGQIFYSFLMGDMLYEQRQGADDLRDELTELAKRIAATLYNRGLLDMGAKESYYAELLENAPADAEDAA
jgi:hypothetical protein